MPSQSEPESRTDRPLDCETNAAAPMIDTILAVGFAAATFAAVSSDEEGEDGDVSAVSALGVGTATTAAFIASAAHGHNSIQSCLAQRQKNVPSKGASATATATASRPAPSLVSGATYAISAPPAP